ncbi:MAG: hypothetical protein WDW36_008828 [Sanguina aurantia]
MGCKVGTRVAPTARLWVARRVLSRRRSCELPHPARTQARSGVRIVQRGVVQTAGGGSARRHPPVMRVHPRPHSCAALPQGVRYVEGGLPLLTPRLRWKAAVEAASSSAQLALQTETSCGWPQARYDALRTKRDAVDAEMQRLQALWATPTNALGAAIESQLGVVVSRETNVLDLLRRPELDYAMLATVSGLGPAVARADVAAQVEVQVKYAGYLLRQREEIERQRRNEHLSIPPAFDYDKVRGLSAEVLLKLKRTLPATVGQAARVSGVTPAAISLLLVHLKRRAA